MCNVVISCTVVFGFVKNILASGVIIFPPSLCLFVKPSCRSVSTQKVIGLPVLVSTVGVVGVDQVDHVVKLHARANTLAVLVSIRPRCALNMLLDRLDQGPVDTVPFQ